MADNKLDDRGSTNPDTDSGGSNDQSSANNKLDNTGSTNPDTDSGGSNDHSSSSSKKKRRRPRKKSKKSSADTDPGVISEEKKTVKRLYNTSFWKGETDKSEHGGKGENDQEGNSENDEKEKREPGTKWAVDENVVQYSESWWEFVPEEPEENEIFDSITPGRNFRGYENLPTKLTGPSPNQYDLPASFEEAGLASRVLSNVKKSKYNQLTPVQQHALPIIMNGRDLVACAQTGSGKTAAYLMPIVTKLLEMEGNLPGYNEIALPVALILVPTQDLARQVYMDALRFTWKTNIRVVRAYGQCSHAAQIKELQNAAGCHIVVASPGRLISFLKHTEQNPREISLEKLKYLVLDEADHMLVLNKSILNKDEDTTSSGFYHDVEHIIKNYDMPSKEDRQTLMFSATIPKNVQAYAMHFLNNHLHLVIGEHLEGATFSDIEQSVIQIAAKDKKNMLLEILLREVEVVKRIIVFVSNKRRTTKLIEFLDKNELSVTGIHSRRFRKEREESLRDFRGVKDEENPVIPILVATAVGSRGLDIQDVELVINYDLPNTDHVGIEEYIHKVGRTGRIGNSGRAISFFDPEKDEKFARSLRKALADSLQEVPDWLDEIAERAFGTKEDQKRLESGDIRYPGRSDVNV